MRNFGIHFAPHFRSCDATAAAGEHRQPRPAAASIQTARGNLSGGNPERSLSRHGGRNTPAEPISLATAKASGSLASLVGLGRTLPRQDEGASFSLPSGSLIDPGSSPFERGDFIQTVRDCIPVIGAFLFLTVTAIAVACATFITLFVDTTK